MFPSTKIVTIGDKDILCKDLTYGYVLDLENGIQVDTPVNAVMNGTGLTDEDMRGLRGSEINVLFHAVMQLTYPNAYNEDGSPKELEEPVEDKKKV